MSGFHGIDVRIASATGAELQALVANSREPVIVSLAKRELASRDRFAMAAAKASRGQPMNSIVAVVVTANSISRPPRE
jgi:hypothetical protein